MTVDLRIAGGPIATMQPDSGEYGLIEGVVEVSGDQIVTVGTQSGEDAITEIDLDGRLLTPALIDCHTHLIFGGTRISEWERRLGGATYADIAAAGGGIISTVIATRAASDAELLEQAAARLQSLVASGVATVEIKSGYGLTLEDELRMLALGRRLGDDAGIRVHTTLLAAHTTPPEYIADPDAYVGLICRELIPAAVAGGLVDSVDAFLEHIAFDRNQVVRVLGTAQAAGLPVRLHADQLSDGGGAALSARFGALSADHLEYAHASGLAAMAGSGTVAVLVPGASAFLGEARLPPVDAMRRLGVGMAVATDLNPGTSPLGSLTAAMWLATTRFGITPAEALAGTTRVAAAALGFADTGVIDVGKRADLAMWEVDHPAALSYWLGRPLASRVWSGGKPIYERRPR